MSTNREILTLLCFLCARPAHQERAILLENWLQTEIKIGDKEWISKLRQKQPKQTKKQRQISDINNEQQFEEYTFYLFPEDQSMASHLKILEKAQAWKQKLLDKSKQS